MTPQDFQKSIIALACWRATSPEPHQAALLVCQVFRNRAAAGWYEGDLYENCWRWLQENPGPFPDTRDPQFLDLLAKLDAVVVGLVADRTSGALFFAHRNQVEKIEGEIVSTFGGMIFIKA